MCKGNTAQLLPVAGSSSVSLSSDLLPPELASSPLSQAAFSLAKEHVHPSILNHCIRTFYFSWLYAQDLPAAGSGHPDWNKDFANEPNIHLLFAACILHDLATSAEYANGSQRFEVEGADAAVKFLVSNGVSPEDAHEVWVAISVHTSPHISERITLLAHLVRRGVITDFTKVSQDAEDSESRRIRQWRDTAEKIWPRLDIEKILGDVVVQQAVKQPGKAPKGSWPGGMYRAHLDQPDWDGVNKAF